MALELTAPPYNFSANGVANMYIAAWIGSTLSFLSGGTPDRFVKVLARRNNDVYEPEFRLWYLIPGTITFVIGYTGWGWGVSVRTPWQGLAVFWALAFYGSGLMNTAVLTYIIDAHRHYSTESQVVVFSFKNMWGFGLGYYFVEWYLSAGPKVSLGIISAISVAVVLPAIPLYLFGKRLRAFWMRHPFLGKSEASFQQ